MARGFVVALILGGIAVLVVMVAWNGSYNDVLRVLAAPSAVSEQRGVTVKIPTPTRSIPKEVGGGAGGILTAPQVALSDIALFLAAETGRGHP